MSSPLSGGTSTPATTGGEGSGLPFTGTEVAALAVGAVLLLLLGGALQLLARRRDDAVTDQR